MKRFITAVFAATALGFGFSAAAQTTSPRQSGDQVKGVQVTGCLQKTSSGGYFLTDAKVNNSSRSRSAESSSLNATKTWNLEGHGSQLNSLVGQRVSVTGNAENEHSGDKLKGQSKSTPEMQGRDFDVKSVMRAGGSCQE